MQTAWKSDSYFEDIVILCFQNCHQWMPPFSERCVPNRIIKLNLCLKIMHTHTYLTHIRVLDLFVIQVIIT